MRIFKVNYFPDTFINYVYAKYQNLTGTTYSEQLNKIFYESFSWGDAWTYYLKDLGYATEEIIYNAPTLQNRWLLENGIKSDSVTLDDIVIMQINKFKPDILWYDHFDAILLCKIKEKCPGVRLIIGWTGSAISDYELWKYTDIVLSCALESVDILKNMGHKCYHLDHAFDKRILDRIDMNKPKDKDAIFIGQLIRASDFHKDREIFLDKLSKKSALTIYSPTHKEYKIRLKRVVKIFIKRIVYNMLNLMDKKGALYGSLIKKRVFYNISILTKKPSYGLHKDFSASLKKCMRPGVFGLEMFQIIRDSKIVLNVHADSSPKYASNMRLYETTGVGSCLLTDWKRNIGDFFEDGKEAVVYKNYEEALEKINYLLSNPKVIEEIALAGQKKTLNEFCFEKRILEFDKIIKANI